MARCEWLRNLRLKSRLHDLTVLQTLIVSRYGISSFVYQARRPFHPKRLFELVHDKFILLQNTEQYEDESEGGDAEEGAADDIADEEGQRDIEDISDSDPDEEGREDSPHSTCSTDLTDDCSETPTSDATRSTEHSDGEKNEVADKDFSKDIPVAVSSTDSPKHIPSNPV